MKRLLLFAILSIFNLYLYAQKDSIKFTKDFRFNDGIYITIEDFKNNNPPLTETNFELYNHKVKYLDNNFFENSNYNEYIRRYVFYPDKNDSIQKKSIDSLFGFVINGYPYIIMSRRYNAGLKVLRVFRLGTISYCFETNASAMNKILNDKTMEKDNNPLLPNIQDYNYTPNTAQFLFHFRSGKLLKYNDDNFEDLLILEDSELFEEYSKLSNSKKEKLLFNYLTKVNERNPIYIYD